MANLINLYTKALELNSKVKRNSDKLAFMSMTKNNMFAYEQYGHQLDAYAAEAKAANDKFAAAAAGLSAAEIFAVITEATQIGAAA